MQTHFTEKHYFGDDTKTRLKFLAENKNDYLKDLGVLENTHLQYVKKRR